MAILTTRLLGDPILQATSKSVEFPLSDETKEFCHEMLCHVQEHKGVGLAAPQVGRSERIILIASKPNERYPDAPDMPPTLMLNPEIVNSGELFVEGWEGCLSIPGIRAKVPRAERITLEYYDIEGQAHQNEFTGFVARIIQHEIDHLDGISFLERVEDRKSFISESEFKNRVLS